MADIESEFLTLPMVIREADATHPAGFYQTLELGIDENACRQLSDLQFLEHLARWWNAVRPRIIADWHEMRRQEEIPSDGLPPMEDVR